MTHAQVTANTVIKTASHQREAFEEEWSSIIVFALLIDSMLKIGFRLGDGVGFNEKYTGRVKDGFAVDQSAEVTLGIFVVATPFAFSLGETSLEVTLGTFVGVTLLNNFVVSTVSCEVGVLLDEIDVVGTFEGTLG